MPKILLLDIETAPKLVLVWRFFKENIMPKQVLEHCHIMSFAAKWLGDDDIYYEDNRTGDDRKIVGSLISFLDEADIVVAHNGRKFDLGTIKGRAMVQGFEPPSPYKIIDTLLVARKEFFFESNSLEYLADVLGCEEKDKHKNFPGFELWLECLKGNEDAWDEMMTYNIQDVETLEEVYLKMRPWITNHPNIGVYDDVRETVCAACGSTHIHFRGYAYTQVGKFRKYQCQEQGCGHWGRLRYNEHDKEKMRALGTNVQY